MRGRAREIAFAGLNTAGVYIFIFHGTAGTNPGARFAVYLALVFAQYVMLWIFAESDGRKPWLAFFTPIAALVFIRYVPASFYAQLAGTLGMASRGIPAFTGISYMAFRSSLLVLEVRNGAVKKPSFFDYLGYCFFVPTMPVGPINPYSNHRRAFDAERPSIPLDRAVLRIIVGLVKYKFLGVVFSQLAYEGLLRDEQYHHWIDLPVAAVFYYLYLYCNFSGFCDAAIGVAGVIGVPVAENFQEPFAARNVKDFWNRWHITLSQYMRDVVFSPLSKFFARLLGPANVNHAVALTIIVVFLLVGVWHGVGWNYAVFGALHALAIVVNHYYTISLKKWLGREGFKAYNANSWIHAVSVAATFCYVAASLFFFANTFSEMKEIFASIK